ncbi:RhoGAP domain-containing protein [Heterostelium album PN500]|uniref:RhoGAP domain-containing protein n=1 Tax=Heterostelium pallidum (strain ATCC 26659 / Pp 5 / PN500) TaxID=670386 RepID=D3BC10_HETP5|nr:RhoGAP domain-containing protein [Heterostelium album PN500]EFA81193.1 RhoGAP domain-containing protein [Heterostelium album PN500]|eukprot:XP_020433311.1 RhoGAP domain-containing protein [Heterostelium album PN500]
MTSTMFAWKNKASTNKQSSQLNIGSAANASGNNSGVGGAGGSTAPPLINSSNQQASQNNLTPQPIATSVSVSSFSPNSLQPQLSSPMLSVPSKDNPLTHSNSTVGLTANSSSSNLVNLAVASSSPIMGSNIGISSASDTSLIYNMNAPVNMLNGMPISPNSEGPPILHKLVRYLMSKGTTTELIFKANPSELESDVQIVKKNLLKDMAMGDIEQIQLSTFTNNPHIVAEILRQYLHALPEPLFSYHLYDSFLLTHTILSQQDKIWAYRFLLAYLPQGFRGTIRAVLSLLSKIHSNHGTTKMDSSALSSIFARVFLRPEEEMYYMKQDRLNTEDIVRLWIEEYDQVTKPPGPPTNKITTVAAFTPSHPVSQSANPNGDPLNPLSPTGASTGGHSHPTIGLNKINSQTQLTNATNPQQSPKLSLPTIPKQQNTQQTTTIIKVKPPLQASSSQNNIKPPSSISGATPTNNTSNSNSNNSSTTTSPTPSPITTAVTNPTSPTTQSLNNNNLNVSNNNNNNINNNTPIKPSTSPSKPSTPTTTSAKPPTSAYSSPSSLSTSTSNLNAIKPAAPAAPATTSSSSPSNSSLTLLSTLDQETMDKINRVKGTTESLISEHVWNQLKSIVKNIEKETNYKETIRLSTILRDSKRHIVDSTEKHLGITKNDVKSFLQQFNKPAHYNLAVLSPESLANPPSGVEELKHHELKRASHLAIEELSDYIFMLKTKIHTFVYKEHVIMTAHVISKLKSIFDQAVSTPGVSTSLSASGSLTINNEAGSRLSISPEHSPLSSPMTSKRLSIGNDKSALRVVEVCSREITDRLRSMRKDLEHASLQEAIEIGKAVRSTKQTLHELYQENNYILPLEIKPAPSTPDEGQLGTLKKTLEPLLDRIFTQIETVTKTASNPATPEHEGKQILDKLLFINKVLSLKIEGAIF